MKITKKQLVKLISEQANANSDVHKWTEPDKFTLKELSNRYKRLTNNFDAYLYKKTVNNFARLRTVTKDFFDFVHKM